jgi:hypothetical protein
MFEGRFDYQQYNKERLIKRPLIEKTYHIC